MKILYLNTFSAIRGGAERAVRDTAVELVERGHEVVAIFAFDDRRSLGGSEWPWGIKRYYVPELTPNQATAEAFQRSTSGETFRSGMRYLGDILEIEGPDIVHVHNLPAVDLLDHVAVSAPMVRTVHSWDTLCESGTMRTPGGGACSEARGEACRALCDQTDVFAFERRSQQNSFMARAFARLLPVSSYVAGVMARNGFDPSRLEVVGNFTRLFAEEPRENPGADGPVVAVGRMTPEKGFRELVDALGHGRTRPALHLIGADDVLWNTAYSREVIAAAEKAGIELKRVGWCDGRALEEAYRRASIVVVPSVWPEPFGLVGIEAMMAGKPVVAFDAGGISDWLETGVTGYLVPPGDIQAFAAAVDRLATRPELRVRMGASARLRAREFFSADAFIPRLLTIYDEAIHESTAHRSRGRATLRDAQRGIGVPV